MQRARKVGSYWSLLPTFRIVAETQSITKAAARLGLSPSAVSRGISQLESALGKPMFHRWGKRLELAPAGEALLLGVRTAMRSVDESAEAISIDGLAGPLTIASCEPWSALHLGTTLSELCARHPAIVPQVVRVPEEKLIPALLRGNIDVAIAKSFTLRTQIEATPLATYATGVFRRKNATSTESRFVELGGRSRFNPWPVDRPRTVSAYVDDYDTMLTVLRSSDLLGVLPKVLVSTNASGALKALVEPRTSDVVLHLLCRAPTVRDGAPQAYRDIALRAVRAAGP